MTISQMFCFALPSNPVQLETIIQDRQQELKTSTSTIRPDPWSTFFNSVFILLRFRRPLLTKIMYWKIYDYWNKCTMHSHVSTTPLIWDTETCRYYDRNQYRVCKCGSLHNQRAISSSRAPLHSWAADPWPSDPGLRSAAMWDTCNV